MQNLEPTPEVGFSRADSQIVIGPMTEHDLLEVVEIEENSGLSHWGWDAYHTELRSQTSSIMLVARSADNSQFAEPRVIGFIVARQIVDEIHVNNVAIRPQFRRQGIARRLLEAVLSSGRKTQARQAVLEVRAGNHAAQQLYYACGFEVVGRRRRYYAAPLEDALLMAVSLEQKP
jgi:ribosomal-protein-alanine N-acetyltransferase